MDIENRSSLTYLFLGDGEQMNKRMIGTGRGSGRELRDDWDFSVLSGRSAETKRLVSVGPVEESIGGSFRVKPWRRHIPRYESQPGLV